MVAFPVFFVVVWLFLLFLVIPLFFGFGFFFELSLFFESSLFFELFFVLEFGLFWVLPRSEELLCKSRSQHCLWGFEKCIKISVVAEHVSRFQSLFIGLGRMLEDCTHPAAHWTVIVLRSAHRLLLQPLLDASTTENMVAW